MSIESEIITIFEKTPNRSYKPKQLAQMLQIPSSKYTAFRQKLKKMVAEGKIVRYKKGRLGQGIKTTEVVGTLHVKTQGYGYLISEDKKIDIYISQKFMNTAFHGDKVRAVLFAQSSGKNPEGKVVEVIERGRQNFVGIFKPAKYWGIVSPDDIKIHRDIYIAPENQLNAKPGEKVVAHLIEWIDERQNPQGKIVEILGKPEAPGVDVLSIARSHDLPDQFPAHVQKSADQIPETISLSEIKQRLDWRNELTFTIDPVDSKDFDDAVSLKILKNNNFLLGVHIADVTYFVKQNSALDKESQNRGTSVYLVDRVIPMFPEHLSNQICSLKPNEDRLTYSVLIELDAQAELINYEIKETIIHSDRRFTYEEVHAIIDGQMEEPKFSGTILKMFDLSKKLIQKRQSRGCLDFSSHEVRIILDKNNKPASIEKISQLDSHRLIEEFMVLANSIVATHIDVFLKNQTRNVLPFPYRIHERPSGDKLQDFRNFLAALGIDFPVKKRVTPKMFQRLQNSIKGTNRQLLIEEVMIRSMMKAKYTVKNVGHFGLALKHYCHFTSPIRRYPDVLVHRLLKQYLKNPDSIPLKSQQLEKMCTNATDMEIRAMEAERASIKAKKLEFMLDKIGETFEGVISGVTSFGIFVEITDYLIEGLVHITNLGDDYYNFDEKRYSLTGVYQGKIFQLGDPVIVKVVLVNPEEKIIDFELVQKLKQK